MSDVPIYSPSDEAADAIVAGAIDWSFLRGLLPTIDPRAAVLALLKGGVPAVVAYLKAEAAKTPNPLDDLAVSWLAQAVEAAIAKWLGIPEPSPMMDDGDAEPSLGHESARTSRKRIEDFIRARGGDPAKFNPLLIQILLILAWPIVEKLLEKWLRS